MQVISAHKQPKINVSIFKIKQLLRNSFISRKSPKSSRITTAGTKPNISNIQRISKVAWKFYLQGAWISSLLNTQNSHWLQADLSENVSLNTSELDHCTVCWRFQFNSQFHYLNIILHSEQDFPDLWKLVYGVIQRSSP